MSTAKDFSIEVWVHITNANGRIVNSFTDLAPVVKADENGNEFVDYYGERRVHPDSKVYVPVEELRFS